jgi:hypothetical protein
VLHLKKLAEELQKRYPKSWRFLKWARRARWLKRARNILLVVPLGIRNYTMLCFVEMSK